MCVAAFCCSFAGSLAALYTLMALLGSIPLHDSNEPLTDAFSFSTILFAAKQSFPAI